MIDHNKIDCIIRKKNYCLWKYSETMYELIKNEHGTYGELCDFKMFIRINPYTGEVLKWKIVEYDVNTIIMDELIHKINDEIDYNEISGITISLEDMCVIIANKI